MEINQELIKSISKMVDKQHNYALKNLENKIGDKNVSATPLTRY